MARLDRAEERWRAMEDKAKVRRKQKQKRKQTLTVEVETDPFARPTGLCVNCGKRPATLQWIGEGGVFAMTHGGGVPWCEWCSVDAQLDYARKQADRIPELLKRLTELALDEKGVES